jgi:hypothetical protein
MILSMPLADGLRDVTGLIEAGRDREAAEQGAARRPTPDGQPMEPVAEFEQISSDLGGVVAGITPDQIDIPVANTGVAMRDVRT